MKKSVVLMAALVAMGVFAEPTAKAVYDANTTTFTFYYDENTYEGEGLSSFPLPTENKWNTAPAWHETDIKASVTKVVFDASFADYRPVNLNDWFSGCRNLTTFEQIEHLNTSNVAYASYLFKDCTSLTSIDLSHFVTTKMMFRASFQNCSNIETLDLTAFTKFQDLRSTFNGMSKLKTIYVSDLLDCTVDETTADTFKGCNQLVGGAGTAFSTAKVTTAGYARLDNPPESPGYFTLAQKPVPPTIARVEAYDLTHDGVTVIVDGETLNDGTIVVELTVGGETAFRSELSDFGTVVFTGLTPETVYAVKVAATSAYGTTVDTSCTFSTPAQPADCWHFDAGAGTLSWSEWTFAATLAKDGTIKVGAVTRYPEVAMALDFSLPVEDAEGVGYVISALEPAFGHHDKASSYKPEGYEPQCRRIGLLTLPGEGLVSIGTAAFAGCSSATGQIVFPSTLTAFGISAFADCAALRIDGATLPEGLAQIPQYCFRGAKGLVGDARLTGVESVADSAFQATSLTSVSFGPGLKSIGGNYERGAFQDCTALTNIAFDAASRVQIATGFTFQGCTRLETLDLRGVVDFVVTSDREDYSHIAGCSKLTRIVFGAGLENLMCNAMAGASALESVVFEGLPPVGLETPYLSPKDRNGAHVAGYDKRRIVTSVHRALVNTPNENGRSWADYAAGRKIAGGKRDPARNTTWAAASVYEGVDLVNRPLVTIEPDVGLVLIIK